MNPQEVAPTAPTQNDPIQFSNNVGDTSASLPSEDQEAQAWMFEPPPQDPGNSYSNIYWSPEVYDVLNYEYQRNNYPSVATISQIAEKTGISSQQISDWFQRQDRKREILSEAAKQRKLEFHRKYRLRMKEKISAKLKRSQELEEPGKSTQE